MLIHSHLPYDQSTSHARVPAGCIHLIASIDSVSEAQVTASFFGSTKALHSEVATPSAETSTHNHSNQQYSITAITTSSGAIAERYAYSAYGEPTICDGSGSTLSSSAINNRYTYTGREWDATVGLYHFRARWMSPKSGRFLGHDPIGYVFPEDELDDLADVAEQIERPTEFNLYQLMRDSPLNKFDPSGNLWFCSVWGPPVIRPCIPADNTNCNTHCFGLGHTAGTARLCYSRTRTCSFCGLLNRVQTMGQAKCSCTSPSWTCTCPPAPAGCVLASKTSSKPGRWPTGGCSCRWHCRGAGGRPIITKPVAGTWTPGPIVTTNL